MNTKISHYEQTNSFRKNNYDHIQLTIAKGQREKIKAHAEKQGLSMNAYIVELIYKDMTNDNISC